MNPADLASALRQRPEKSTLGADATPLAAQFVFPLGACSAHQA